MNIKAYIRGFTLIEMLIVIAIIGILAAMLTPSLQNALETSKMISCANNERQICLLVFSYSDENEGILPAAVLKDNKPWFQTLSEKYMNSDESVWKCPGREREDTSLRNDYGWNFTGAESYSHDGLGYIAFPTKYITVNRRGWPVRIVTIKQPSRTYMFGSARDDFKTWIGLMGSQKYYGVPSVPPFSSNGQDAYPIVHRDGLNAAFIDGHVLFQTQLFMSSDEASPLWTTSSD